MNYQLVPDKICKVNSALEEFIRIESDHFDIARVTPSHLLEKSVQRAVSATLARIEQEEKLDSFGWLQQESTMAQRTSLDGRASIEAPGGHPLWDFSTTKRDPLLPCHVLPHAKNEYFHDRTDVLSLLKKNLAPVDENGLPRKGLKIFALSGPGGMGKTQVANHYAWTHTDMYEAILWVHGEELSTLTDDFSRLAERLGLVLEGSADAMDPVLTRELVKGWMAKPVRSYNGANNSSAEEVPWLLVFDNVHDMDFLSDVWPRGASNGSILVTSRDTLAKSPSYESNGIDLRPMSDKDASDLLLKMTSHEDNQEEYRLSFEVADKLGGLPLALTQMAGVMVRLHLSFSQFLKRYEEDERHIELFRLSFEPKYKRTGYEHTLASVWALEKLEHSSGLLHVMAFLDPDGIPEEYLEGAVGKAAVAALSDYPRSVTEYQDARAELLDSSLIMVDGSSSKLTIHRLTQDVAKSSMNRDRMTAVFSTAVEILSSNWPQAERGVRHHVARWKQCESVSPHILRLKDRFLRPGERLKLVWPSNVNFASLINELGWYFQERGRTDDALGCYRIAETIVKDIQDKQQSQLTETEEEKKVHILLAEIHNNMGGAETERNNADKALHHFQLYNKLLKDMYNGQSDISDSSLTTSYFNMGMSCTMKGNYQKAIEYMTQALKEAEKLGDPSKIKPARSLALINLGLTYWLMDRLEDASNRLETALREREELLGPNDRQSMITGRALYGLGNVRRAQGLLDESLQFHERALLHFKETVGNNHHRTGNSCFKVAEHYSRTGKLDEAL
ncbi:hypothetical protein CDV55_108149 [Aspergillus turcosus]|nr:hypothetical protein CDV55_108149 [Aspergillus turcosus]